MKKVRLLLVVLIMAGLAAAVYYFVIREKPANGRIRLSGNIEATTAQIGFKIAGRLLTRPVGEGQAVTAGQALATLERVDQEVALARAEAKLAQSQAQLVELENGSRPQEIAVAQAAVEASQAGVRSAAVQLERARADHERYKALVARGVISAREYEVYRTQYQAAAATVDQTRAQEKSARESLDLRVVGARPEQIAQARAVVEMDREAVHQARLQLEYTEVTAPFAGVILSKSAEPGEYLNPGAPVVTVGRLDRVWLRAYVSERDLGRISLGQEAALTTDTFPQRIFPGRVSFISSEAEFTPKSVQTQEERIKLMYRVKIELDNPGLVLKPGMPADAWLKPGGGA